MFTHDATAFFHSDSTVADCMCDFVRLKRHNYPYTICAIGFIIQHVCLLLNEMIMIDK